MLSCRDMAPWLNTHSPTTKWREGGGASHQRGTAFPRTPGRLYGFRRQRRYKKWRRRRRTSPAQRYYIPPEGGSPEPVREASAGPGQNPWRIGPKGLAAPSTLTPVRACQPSGILESTAQVQVPIPIPTAPQAPEPSRPKGACPSWKQKNCEITRSFFVSLFKL